VRVGEQRGERERVNGGVCVGAGAHVLRKDCDVISVYTASSFILSHVP
jgi:hypothetical protein